MRSFMIILVLFCKERLVKGLNSDLVECQPTSPCVCSYPTGLDIDLSPLNVSITANNFSTVANQSHMYFYHPCQDVPLNVSQPSISGVLWLFTANSTQSAPLSSAAVLNGSVNGSFSVLALANQASFELTRLTLNEASVKYINDTTVSLIELDCVEEGDTSLILLPVAKDPTVTHSLLLRGPLACARDTLGTKHHMSVGSVLVVMTLTFGLIYFFGGCLLLKYLRGADGVEMIPNHEFWTELPGLVRDGVIFALSCGRTRPDSYEQI